VPNNTRLRAINTVSCGSKESLAGCRLVQSSALYNFSFGDQLLSLILEILQSGANIDESLPLGHGKYTFDSLILCFLSRRRIEHQRALQLDGCHIKKRAAAVNVVRRLLSLGKGSMRIGWQPKSSV